MSVGSNTQAHFSIDPTPALEWVDEAGVTIQNMTATLRVVHYRENGTRTGSEPQYICLDLDEPTIVPLSPIVECATTATARGAVCFAFSHGTVEDLEVLPGIAPGAPAGIVFPHGMFFFKITGLNPAQEVTLTVELPDSVPVGTKWWEYQGASWYPLAIGVDDGDNIIMVTLQDGVLPGDEDSIPGQITDPGGPGDPGLVGSETYRIGKVRVLIPWIALFAHIATCASLLVLSRRRTQT